MIELIITGIISYIGGLATTYVAFIRKLTKLEVKIETLSETLDSVITSDKNITAEISEIKERLARVEAKINACGFE